MRKALPWIGLGMLAASVASNMIGCSSEDPATSPGKGGSAGQGGKGGSFAASGGGGAGGTAGKGGSAADAGAPDAKPPPTRLGKACATTDECGTGLQCVTAASGSFGDGGPAKGYCTAPCMGSDAGNGCDQFGAGSICLNYGTDAAPASWCVQGCTFGPRGSTNFDSLKCHGRREVACAPLFNDLGTGCTVDSDCGMGEICGTTTCLEVFQGCLPQCNSDADCAGSGLFCDPSDGLCKTSQRTGSALGTPCTQNPDGANVECKGNCTGFVVSSGGQVLTTMCTENCTNGAVPSCNWAGPSSGMAADGYCLFTNTVILDRGGTGAGDRGSCGQLCNCNGDCRNPRLVCRDFGGAALKQATLKQGYCSLPEEDDGGLNPGIACGADAGATDAASGG